LLPDGRRAIRVTAASGEAADVLLATLDEQMGRCVVSHQAYRIDWQPETPK
jgi:hypothetical protein